VATVHDLAWRRFPDVATRRGRRLFEAWLADARRADVVLCPSEATARDLEEAGVDDSAIRVVPLGVSASEVPREAVDALRRRHDIDRPFVLWLGTVEPRKNLGILVEAMRLAPGLVDVPLVLVGPSGWSEDVDRLVAPLSGRVRVVGAVPSSERDLWLAAATVLCLPSLHEGFGLPALEAMAHGTPVVASADTAIAEVVADAGLLADPADAGDVGEALAAVLGDASLASRLGSAGRERAAGYTWAATANETVAAYRDAMARWDR